MDTPSSTEPPRVSQIMERGGAPLMTHVRLAEAPKCTTRDSGTG